MSGSSNTNISGSKTRTSGYSGSQSSDIVAERKTKRGKRSFHFPGRHQNGASNVYRKILGYRDNSSFLEKLFSNYNNALCFTRPMQLGKTTLFSLADEFFSVNKTSNVDTDLSYSPGGGDRNKWFVLRIDFGTVRGESDQRNNEQEEEWVQVCKALDDQTESIIKQKTVILLLQNKDLHETFKTVSLGKDIKKMTIGELIATLVNAIHILEGRLLILVDEYDQPVREGLLRLIPHHGQRLYDSVKNKIKHSFMHYFAFFGAAKVALEQLSHAKIWLTGITPIGIDERSGLNVVHLTFREEMADAVGLTESDVQGMLGHVHEHTPFQVGERERAMDFLKHNFNSLRFPSSQPLYHTALVNSIMNMMLDDPNGRREFLRDGNVPKQLEREPVPSSIFSVLCNARNLRYVVNKLADGDQITGYAINERLSLEYLLQETIKVGDYLTLLLHIGVVSATGTTTVNPTLAMTSEFYRENLLEPLLNTLRVSLVTLVSLKSTKELYSQGEDILVDFVTCISKNNMTRLMTWASSDVDNHILELQFQSYIVTEAHEILNGVARTSQEDKFPETGRRTDVTFSSEACVVILELKQFASASAPAAAFISKAHHQLAGYVETRRTMEDVAKGRPVAGFVVVMYNDGASYVVEKLRGDSSHEKGEKYS